MDPRKKRNTPVIRLAAFAASLVVLVALAIPAHAAPQGTVSGTNSTFYGAYNVQFPDSAALHPSDVVCVIRNGRVVCQASVISAEGGQAVILPRGGFALQPGDTVATMGPVADADSEGETGIGSGPAPGAPLPPPPTPSAPVNDGGAPTNDMNAPPPAPAYGPNGTAPGQDTGTTDANPNGQPTMSPQNLPSAPPPQIDAAPGASTSNRESSGYDFNPSYNDTNDAYAGDPDYAPRYYGTEYYGPSDYGYSVPYWYGFGMPYPYWYGYGYPYWYGYPYYYGGTVVVARSFQPGYGYFVNRPGYYMNRPAVGVGAPAPNMGLSHPNPTPHYPITNNGIYPSPSFNNPYNKATNSGQYGLTPYSTRSTNASSNRSRPAYGSGSSYGRSTYGSSYGRPTYGSSYGRSTYGSSYGRSTYGSSYGRSTYGSSYGRPTYGSSGYRGRSGSYRGSGSRGGSGHGNHR